MEDFKQRYIAARRAVIAQDLSRLNPMQRQAAMTTEGPLLLLAGAGSGKTTVLIQRVYNLLTYGRGSDSDEVPVWATEEDLQFLESFPARPTEEDVRRARRLCALDAPKPWEIIAITFTNKAAGELKDRLAARLGPDANDIWASTFHSACVRILRRDIDRLGFDKDFTIYDTDDSKRVIKDVLKEKHLDEKTYPPRSVLAAISHSKDQYETPEDFAKRYEAAGDWKMTRIAKIYAAYAKKLRTANALDFDDIIFHTVTLLQQERSVLDYYQRKFRYVLVDEYQDTNHLQYLLTSLLAGGYKNLCVVGDDDQSIYRFRGANIENILNFEEQYPTARTIRLEQNYRSTQNILDAANAVIQNNQGRKGKTLWTDNGGGDVVTIKTTFNESDEANYVAGDILMGVNRGRNFRDTAVLYRMNAQSNMLERALVRSGVPYRIYGGTRFYDRKEIRDIIAYMSIVENPNDRVRFERIVNEPKRGIGDATLSLLQDITQDLHLSPLEVMRNADQYPVLSKKMNALKKFAVMWDELIEAERELPLEKFLDVVLEKTGYRAALEQMGEEGTFRLENVEELKSSILTYQNEAEEPSLGGFLEEISLYTDVDKYEPEQDVVMLMTVHSAKGLEFQNVFLVGMEQGVFPGNRSLDSREDLEEERRLAYVALTRAKKKLTLTTAASRMLFGMTMRNLPSQFLTEIDRQLIEQEASQRQSRRGISADKLESVQSISLQRQMASAKPQKYKAEPKEFHVGERVRHATFGDGTVLAITKMANDAMLEVGFDQVGTKRLMASHPKIKKLL